MTFNDQSAISVHYDTVHVQLPTKARKPDNNTRAFHCIICQRSFSRKDYLQSHVSRAHGIGPLTMYACPQCDKTFKDKSNMRRHMKIKHSQQPSTDDQ